MAKRLSRLNIVSVTLGCLVIGAVYMGIKYVPVYWMAHRVGSELDRVANDLDEAPPGHTQGEVLTHLFERIAALGVARDRLVVGFSDDRSRVEADFSVQLHHWFGWEHTMTFHESRALAD